MTASLFSQAPILAVLIPLLGAPVCGLLRGGIFPWLFTTVLSLLSFWFSIELLLHVNANGPISYELGAGHRHGVLNMLLIP